MKKLLRIAIAALLAIGSIAINVSFSNRVCFDSKLSYTLESLSRTSGESEESNAFFTKAVYIRLARYGDIGSTKTQASVRPVAIERVTTVSPK